jgi:Leucine-rich repeat (LRR) protein
METYLSTELQRKISNWIRRKDYDRPLDISGLCLNRLPLFTGELNKIKKLICSNNQISYFESKDLPLELEYLDCSHNKLSFIPDLPITLDCLICSNNKIDYIQVLPPYLRTLVCSYNQIRSFEDIVGFPQSISYFDCSYNLIEKIPELPPTIEYIILKGNQIKESIKFFNHTKSYISFDENSFIENSSEEISPEEISPEEISPEEISSGDNEWENIEK